MAIFPLLADAQSGLPVLDERLPDESALGIAGHRAAQQGADVLIYEVEPQMGLEHAND